MTPRFTGPGVGATEPSARGPRGGRGHGRDPAAPGQADTAPPDRTASSRGAVRESSRRCAARVAASCELFDDELHAAALSAGRPTLRDPRELELGPLVVDDDAAFLQEIERPLEPRDG